MKIKLFESDSWKMEHARILASRHVRSRTNRFNIYIFFTYIVTLSCEEFFFKFEQQFYRDSYAINASFFG
jgi:hypothetical protein